MKDILCALIDFVKTLTTYACKFFLGLVIFLGLITLMVSCNMFAMFLG